MAVKIAYENEKPLRSMDEVLKLLGEADRGGKAYFISLNTVCVERDGTSERRFYRVHASAAGKLLFHAPCLLVQRNIPDPDDQTRKICVYWLSVPGADAAKALV